MRSLFLINLFFLFGVSKAQLNFNSYAVFKKQYVSDPAIGYDRYLNKKVFLKIGNTLYVVRSVHDDSVTLEDYISGISLQVKKSNLLFFDKMGKNKRKLILDGYLNKVAKAYKSAELKKSETSDSVDYLVFQKDSIYENLYTPVREQLTKSWFKDQDMALISLWFKFLNAHMYGDDALNAKFLTICFLKHPAKFSKVLNAQGTEIKSKISLYMLGSSGFMYATDELKKDYRYSILLFKMMINFPNE